MTTGYDARIAKKSDFHKFPDGYLVTLVSQSPSGNFYLEDDAGWGQHVPPDEIEWLNEDENMATSKKSVSAGRERNPKNFRNGDVIKVSNKDEYAALVYVKFGENYYNLTAGGQMKACRYLPPGQKEIITNLSGMGKFFLMSEEELEEQASRPSGGSITDTDGTRWGCTQDYITATDIIQRWEDAIKNSQDMIKTDTTEEK